MAGWAMPHRFVRMLFSSQLSGGEQQRVAIAPAIAKRPCSTSPTPDRGTLHGKYRKGRKRLIRGEFPGAIYQAEPTHMPGPVLLGRGVSK